MEFIGNYDKVEKEYDTLVNYIVFYSRGGLTYEDAWTLPIKKLSAFEDIIKDNLEMQANMNPFGGGI